MKKINKTLNQDVLDLGVSQYQHAVGLDVMERDGNGFIKLIPTAKRVDEKKASLTTDISTLETKLKQFKSEHERLEKYQKTDEYKASKKKMSKKKKKKKRDTLLEMVFNNADNENNEDEEDEDGVEYKDIKKPKERKKPETTLDTTYGKRFSPMVSMYYDTITEFDQIASDIETELKDSRSQSKSMYRSSQIGNLLAAKKNKMDAINKLTDIAKIVSDLEYKREKDKKDAEGGDTSRAISALGAKYLRGGVDIFDNGKGKKKKKKDDGFNPNKKKYDIDDDDEDEDSTIKKQREQDQRELAVEFAKTLMNHKNDIHLTAHEKYARLEGQYTVACVVDSVDNEDWKFIALDKKGKEIKGFKDDYPGLLPRKKDCRMVFDFSRLKAYDKNSARTYKILLKNN